MCSVGSQGRKKLMWVVGFLAEAKLELGSKGWRGLDETKGWRALHKVRGELGQRADLL